MGLSKKPEILLTGTMMGSLDLYRVTRTMLIYHMYLFEAMLWGLCLVTFAGLRTVALPQFT